MLKNILFLAILGALVNMQAIIDKDLKKSSDLKEKVLFMNKSSYDQEMKKRYDKSQKNKKEMKIYKRSDGSIDTFKTINEANR
jgi:hypothetical protein